MPVNQEAFDEATEAWARTSHEISIEPAHLTGQLMAIVKRFTPDKQWNKDAREALIKAANQLIDKAPGEQTVIWLNNLKWQLHRMMQTLKYDEILNQITLSTKYGWKLKSLRDVGQPCVPGFEQEIMQQDGKKVLVLRGDFQYIYICLHRWLHT